VKENGVINELLKKYDLMLPVLKSEQRRILRSKKRTLAVILSEKKKSSFIIAMAVRFYYMMRNTGLNVTPVSGLRAAAFAAAMTVVIITGSSVLLVQHYIQKTAMIAEKAAGVKGVLAAFSDGLVIKRNNVEITSLKAKDGIIEGDEISTGDSSLLLQFDNGVVVKIMKRSTVIVAKTGTIFDLEEGGMLSRVPGTAAVSGYKVRTPDSVIAVKGTEFGVHYENGKTKVVVIKGIVLVEHITSGTEYEVPEVNETEVNEQKKIGPLSEESKSVMNGFANLNYTEAIDLKSEEELKELGEKLKASDVKKSSGRMTLAEFREKYGRLDEIMLYHGKKYTGVIISRGAVYKILTPSGTVTVPARDVKGSRVIQ